MNTYRICFVSVVGIVFCLFSCASAAIKDRTSFCAIKKLVVLSPDDGAFVDGSNEGGYKSTKASAIRGILQTNEAKLSQLILNKWGKRYDIIDGSDMFLRRQYPSEVSGGISIEFRLTKALQLCKASQCQAMFVPYVIGGTTAEASKYWGTQSQLYSPEQKEIAAVPLQALATTEDYAAVEMTLTKSIDALLKESCQ